MRRVHVVYSVRRLVSPLAIKMEALAALAVASALFVSVGNVVANMPSATHPSAFAQFHVNAFLETELAVQAVLVGIAMLVYFIARDVKKAGFKRRRAPALIRAVVR